MRTRFRSACVLGVVSCVLALSCSPTTPNIQDTPFNLNAIDCIQSYSSGTHLVAASSTGEIVVWDLKTSNKVFSCKIGDHPIPFSISSNDRWIVVGGGNFRLIDTHSWKVRELNATGLPHQFLQIGAHFAYIDPENRLCVCDCEQNSILAIHSRYQSDLVVTMATSRCNPKSFLALGRIDGSVELWQFMHASKGSHARLNHISTVSIHQAPVWGLQFASEDTLLCTSSGEGELALLEVPSLQVKQKTKAHDAGISGLLADEANDFVVSVAFDYSVAAWKLESLQSIWSVRVDHQTSCQCITRGANMRELFVGLPTGQIKRIIMPH